MAGDLQADFGGVSAVDSSSPQRANNVSPGNPWDLSVLDPMVASQPQVCNESEKPIFLFIVFLSIVWLIDCRVFRRGGTYFRYISAGLRIRITSMRIWAQLFTSLRIWAQLFTSLRIWAQLFTSLRIRILVFTLLWIRIRFFSSPKCCKSATIYLNADPDPAFHCNADPNPQPCI
jgi:hypothetical protein